MFHGGWVLRAFGGWAFALLATVLVTAGLASPGASWLLSHTRGSRRNRMSPANVRAAHAANSWCIWRNDAPSLAKGAIGFWSFLVVFMWALSGVYLVFPHPFSALVDYLQPLDPKSLTPRQGDLALEWLAKLHFGRFASVKTKALWTFMLIFLFPLHERHHSIHTGSSTSV